MITEKVRKRIRSRSGNGAPASVWSGIASAAASETAPRMLDQATSVTSFQPRRRPLGPAISRAHAAVEEAQPEPRRSARRSRPRETSDRVAEQLAAVVALERVERAGSSSPIRMNRTALSRNWRISQTAIRLQAGGAVVSSEARQPSTTPTVTAAITPERPSSSAGR